MSYAVSGCALCRINAIELVSAVIAFVPGGRISSRRFGLTHARKNWLPVLPAGTLTAVWFVPAAPFSSPAKVQFGGESAGVD